MANVSQVTKISSLSLFLTMVVVCQPSPGLDLEGLGRMFYIASPSATSFPDLKAIPKSYVDQAMPYFFIMSVNSIIMRTSSHDHY